MKNLDEIETALKEAKDALSHVEGKTAEVYSRIVGYYRSVRNWNKGKREEYGERRLYDLAVSDTSVADTSVGDTCAANTDGHQCPPPVPSDTVAAGDNAGSALRIVERTGASDTGVSGTGVDGQHVILFVRQTCPACPGAKAAAGQLGIPVDTVNADTKAGLAEAVRRNVMSTPTAILLGGNGEELGRAKDSAGIASLRRFLPSAGNPLAINPLAVAPLAGQRRDGGYKTAASL
jgi:ribonucleoside-triphosphate reductase